MTKYQQAERRLYIDFSHRVHEALKPGTKMWQKANKQPLTWPDPIKLIEWLTKEAKSQEETNMANRGNAGRGGRGSCGGTRRRDGSGAGRGNRTKTKRK